MGAISDASIANSYSVGPVVGNGEFFGGLIGAALRATINDAFWDIETSRQDQSAGGIGKTTEEMRMEATFTNWDFDWVWDIEEGVGYPFLRTEDRE